MTHLDLLNQLPSPIREQAIENCKNYKGKEWFSDSYHNNLVGILQEGFLWYQTPDGQGWDYWLEIYKRAKAGEFDKPKDPCVTLPREDWEWLLNVVEFNPNPKAKSIREAIQSQLNSQQ